MLYKARNFRHLLGMKGFSDAMLENHLKLYEGYVTQANRMIESLSTLLKEERTGTPEYAELKRRLGWEYNGMRLHELYFENLSRRPQPLPPSERLARQMKEDFGSVEAWERDFRSTGALRGIGWAIQTYEPVGHRLFNVWVDEHNVGHFAGATPLLVMDVFEHAYMLDYGLQRAEYIEAFFQAIDWNVVLDRFAAALSRTQ
ncbi:MAG: superoxide dismutase [Planctomycetes bacterium]|nr:superoxide dismutase [Planctomycetota bacterium]